MADQVNVQSRAETVLGHIKAAGQAALAEGEKIAKEIVAEGEKLIQEGEDALEGKQQATALEHPDNVLDEPGFDFELGAKVWLFEHNHDGVGGKLPGYQPAIPGKIVKITEDSDVIDVQTGGETSPAITSHNVPYRTQADDGENYWSETPD